MPMSARERATWLLLSINLVLAAWYYGTVFPAPASTDMHSPEMARLVGRLILIAVLIAIAGEIALRWLAKSQAGSVEIDERDRLIDLKAARNGFVVVTVAIVSVLFQVAMLESLHRYSNHMQHADRPTTVFGLLLTGPLSTLLVAQLLLLALTLSGLSVYASRLYYYRRGY